MNMTKVVLAPEVLANMKALASRDTEKNELSMFCGVVAKVNPTTLRVYGIAEPKGQHRRSSIVYVSDSSNDETHAALLEQFPSVAENEVLLFMGRTAGTFLPEPSSVDEHNAARLMRAGSGNLLNCVVSPDKVRFDLLTLHGEPERDLEWEVCNEA